MGRGLGPGPGAGGRARAELAFRGQSSSEAMRCQPVSTEYGEIESLCYNAYLMSLSKPHATEDCQKLMRGNSACCDIAL
jgi:hypothetical protein